MHPVSSSNKPQVSLNDCKSLDKLHVCLSENDIRPPQAKGEALSVQSLGGNGPGGESVCRASDVQIDDDWDQDVNRNSRNNSRINLNIPKQYDQVVQKSPPRLVREASSHRASKKSSGRGPVARRELCSNRASETGVQDRQRRLRGLLGSQSAEHPADWGNQVFPATAAARPTDQYGAIETTRKRRCFDHLGARVSESSDAEGNSANRAAVELHRRSKGSSSPNEVKIDSIDTSSPPNSAPSSIYTVDPQLTWLHTGRPRLQKRGTAQDVSQIDVPGTDTVPRESSNFCSFESRPVPPSRGGRRTLARSSAAHGTAPSEFGGAQSTIAGEIERIGSVLEEGIFHNIHEPNVGLGLPPEPERKAQHTRLRKTFRSLRRAVDNHQAKARLELFQIYNVVRDPFFDCDTIKLLRLMGLISTLAGASATLSFIEHQVLLRDESDPIMRLDSVVQTLLLFICYLHPKKKLDIMALLHRCFEQSKQAPQVPANAPTAAADGAVLQLHKEQLFSFLMWMIGAGGYIGVFTFLKLHVQEIDSALLRRFIELLFQYCLPPYSTSFAEALVELLYDVICINTALDFGNAKNFYLSTLISQLIPHAIRAWSPLRPPGEVLSMMNSLQAHIGRPQLGEGASSSSSTVAATEVESAGRQIKN